MKLYIVPTPVGNLADMTFRAVEVLKTVDLILAEDTRTSQPLLSHYDIHTPLQSYHIFNEHQVTQRIVERIESGMSVAIITDAGTPGISDPGFFILREAVRKGIEVECLPGATALIPAVVSSGLPCDRFVFEGFLPHKKGRQSRLNALKEEARTIIFYESPYRLEKLLQQLAETFGSERQAAVCRELSKLHEEIVRGTIEEIQQHFATHTIKGEIVVVVAGRQDSKEADE